jgi:hypothetical protein
MRAKCWMFFRLKRIAYKIANDFVGLIIAVECEIN